MTDRQGGTDSIREISIHDALDILGAYYTRRHQGEDADAGWARLQATIKAKAETSREESTPPKKESRIRNWINKALDHADRLLWKYAMKTFIVFIIIGPVATIVVTIIDSTTMIVLTRYWPVLSTVAGAVTLGTRWLIGLAKDDELQRALDSAYEGHRKKVESQLQEAECDEAACKTAARSDKPSPEPSQLVTSPPVPRSQPHRLRVRRDSSGAADLASMDLRGVELLGVNLIGARMAGANMEGSRLRGANLYGADLSAANIFSADLSRAELANVNLHQANLSFALLAGARLACANLSGAHVTGANLSSVIASRTDFSSADLSGAILAGTDLSEADLSDAILTGAYMSGAHLHGVNLENANLSWASLRKAYIYRANLSHANLNGANLLGAVLKYSILIEANLIDTKISDISNMEEVTWSEGTKWGSHREEVLRMSVPIGRGRYKLNPRDGAACSDDPLHPKPVKPLILR
ncbi:pentapeptide repeat-containing protein [Nocardia sp. BMG51109]|uniref:pentapeptide repeat-containing protein n=1 Tax=Nocardia sp. BMG51109 TaxID=1056816 RepID=UPI0004BA2844|nr:pentapeptide repeat-containing protein [Nocardia sp. BMG51109]